MSEHNYAGLIFTNEREQHPERFTVNLEQVDEAGKKLRAQRAITNPSKPQSTYEEYKQLRGRLHTLEQNAANYATYFSNIEGSVALLEKRVKEADQDKQNAFRSGNSRGETTYQNRLSLLKNELAEAQRELKSAKGYKETSAKALAAFDQHERIAELQAHFDSLVNV